MISNRMNCSKCPGEAKFVIAEFDSRYCGHHFSSLPIDVQAMAVPVNSDTAVKTRNAGVTVLPYPTGATAQDADMTSKREEFPPFALNATDLRWLADHRTN